MNLLTDPWLPVVCQDGTFRKVAPYQITDTNNPILFVAAPRSDLSTALTQFLVGLVQTTFAPDTYQDWDKSFRNPPSPGALKKSFAGYEDAFELDGDGARFLQDPALKNDKKAELVNSACLMAGSPGNKTVKQNTDIFFRDGSVEHLCPSCAAAALYNCQMSFGPPGKGHFSSPYKGRIVTLMEGRNLWETVWLNVMPSSEFKDEEHTQRPFPWLDPKKYMKEFTGFPKTGKPGWTPDKFPKYAAFWPMPGRFFLVFEKAYRNGETLSCDLCGEQSDVMVSQMRKKNRGISYGPGWSLPWTPTYRSTQGNNVNSYPLGSDFVPSTTYQHWTGLILQRGWTVVSKAKAKECREIIPARVVTDMFEVPEKISKDGYHLWVFGYTIVNTAKFARWTDGRIPLTVGLTSQVRDRFLNLVRSLVTSARLAVSSVQMTLLPALGVQPDDKNYKKIKKGLNTLVEEQFWPTTDSSFYELLPDVFQLANSGEDQTDLMKNWHVLIAHAARNIFDKKFPKRLAIIRLNTYENTSHLGNSTFKGLAVFK